MVMKRVVPLEDVESVTQEPMYLDESFIDAFPIMSNEQAGHLRHFHNLVKQKDGEWRHMGSQKAGQELLDGYRYQLATMTYAAGATHYFRLPLLRSLFQTLLEKLIAKMLLGDVWGYWYLTSQSGVFVDPDLKELRKPWADPIKRENIMYSGHLLHMVSLYSMLFDSDRYEESDAFLFDWEPTFWGMGPEKFTYNLTSLQEAILKDMERENWLGVCCEPNSIFIVCNQFPMIGMRYNDVRKGTDVAPTVLKKYQKAWNSTGMFQDDGLLIDWFSPKQKSKTYAQDPGFTAWAAAFLNAWSPEIANTAYKTAHKMVLQTVADYSHSAAADHPVKTSTATKPVKPLPGYVAQMISEVGDEPALTQYLEFIDTAYNSTWEEGGLFYPASGQRTDDLRPMDSLSGNAGIPYARLNIFDGQRKMYEKPWTKEHFSTYPFIDNVDLSSGVDFLRGAWNESLAAMAITMRTYFGINKTVNLDISGLRQGRYRLYENRKLLGAYKISTRMDIIQLKKNVNNEAVDIVIQRA